MAEGVVDDISHEGRRTLPGEEGVSFQRIRTWKASKDPDSYTRTERVRHLLAAYELGEDKLLGHVKPRNTRPRFLEFCRYLRTLYPPAIRTAIVCDNFSPHLTTAKDSRVGAWASANNVEIAYTPTNSSWLNRVEAQFTALRYFASMAPITPATRNRPA